MLYMRGGETEHAPLKIKGPCDLTVRAPSPASRDAPPLCVCVCTHIVYIQQIFSVFWSTLTVMLTGLIKSKDESL